MAKRTKTTGAHGSPGRYAYTSRSFDASIDQLTAESIAASLAEIERALERRFGEEHFDSDLTPSPMDVPQI